MQQAGAMEHQLLISRVSGDDPQTVRNAVKNLTEKLASALLNKAGAKAFRDVFKTDIQCFFRGVPDLELETKYQYIPFQVSKGTSNYLRTLIHWITYEYLGRKEAKEPKETLGHSLQVEIYSNLQLKLAELQDPNLRESVLYVHTFIACMNLVLMQELVAVDAGDDPNCLSTFTHEIKRMIGDYIKHTEICFLNMMMERAVNIGQVNKHAMTNLVENARYVLVKWEDGRIQRSYSTKTKGIDDVWTNGTPDELFVEAGLTRARYIYDKIDMFREKYSTTFVALTVWKLLCSK